MRPDKKRSSQGAARRVPSEHIVGPSTQIYDSPRGSGAAPTSCAHVHQHEPSWERSFHNQVSPEAGPRTTAGLSNIHESLTHLEAWGLHQVRCIHVHPHQSGRERSPSNHNGMGTKPGKVNGPLHQPPTHRRDMGTIFIGSGHANSSGTHPIGCISWIGNDTRMERSPHVALQVAYGLGGY